MKVSKFSFTTTTQRYTTSKSLFFMNYFQNSKSISVSGAFDSRSRREKLDLAQNERLGLIFLVINKLFWIKKLSDKNYTNFGNLLDFNFI